MTLQEFRSGGLRLIGAFQVPLASFLQSINAGTNSTRGFAFNSDGRKLFTAGGFSDNVVQISLTTPFDLSTASFNGKSFDLSGQDAEPQGLTFSNDGTVMFMMGNNSETVYQYSLTTAFDVDTASFNNTSFGVAGQEATPNGVEFNDDGTTMFIIGARENSVFQYSLTNPFDISSASYTGTVLDVEAESGNISNVNLTGMTFNPNGRKMFIIGSSNTQIYQYSLTTGFDVGTASFTGKSFDISAQGTRFTGVTFNNDGTLMFVIEKDADSVFQYVVGEVAPK